MTEEKKCMAKTSSGDSCNNKAVWPKDDPKACHLDAHQRQIMEDTEPQPEEVLEEVETLDNEHVFSCTSLNYLVFVDYPEDDERDYFRVNFTGGRYTTTDDEKAKLLEESIEKSKSLKRKITKVQ